MTTITETFFAVYDSSEDSDYQPCDTYEEAVSLLEAWRDASWFTALMADADSGSLTVWAVAGDDFNEDWSLWDAMRSGEARQVMLRTEWGRSTVRSSLTVGQLRAALAGLSDATLVTIYAADWYHHIEEVEVPEEGGLATVVLNIGSPVNTQTDL